MRAESVINNTTGSYYRRLKSVVGALVADVRMPADLRDGLDSVGSEARLPNWLIGAARAGAVWTGLPDRLVSGWPNAL